MHKQIKLCQKNDHKEKLQAKFKYIAMNKTENIYILQ